MLFSAIAFEIFGVDFLNFDAGIIGDAAMNDGFVNGFVSVLKFDVFADDGNADAMLRGDEFADDFLPMGHVRGRVVQAQETANEVIDAFALKHERDFVDGVVDVFFFDDGLERDVAKKGDFLANIFVERFFAATDNDVRRDTDFAEFGDGLLSGFGLEFAGGFDEGDVSNVEEDGVVVANLEGEFANGFEKREALDVAGGAADFGDDNIRLGLLG